MPKKFEGHGKGEPAKVRKAEKEKAEKDRQERAKEDASWVDDAKEIVRKQERSSEKQQKAAELAARKAEAKALLEKEEAELTKTKDAKPAKITQATISAMKRQSEINALAEAEAKATAARRLTVQDDLLLTENPNQITLDEHEEEARGVDEALELLSPGSIKIEKQKSLFAQFSEEMTPQIQAENPGLKLSQIKERVKRAWSRSPRNPNNAK